MAVTSIALVPQYSHNGCLYIKHQLTYSIALVPQYSHNGCLDIKHQLTYSIALVPQYSHNGCLDVKHQLTYSIALNLTNNGEHSEFYKINKCLHKHKNKIPPSPPTHPQRHTDKL